MSVDRAGPQLVRTAGAARRGAPSVALAILVVVLALAFFGGYHPRHWTIVALALVAWAARAAATGRLPAARSQGGLLLATGIVLTLWTALSITWSHYSRHLAWDETNRTAMYTAALAVGAALGSSGASITRLTRWLGIGIGFVGGVIALRLIFGDAPVSLFTSGRLDWPIRYSNGLAGLCYVGMWPLLGWSCAAERRFVVAGAQGSARSRLQHLTSSAGALGLATIVSMLAVLTQSRGGVIALAVSIPIAIAWFPTRTALLVRLSAIGGAALLARHRLAVPFEWMTQADLARFDAPDRVAPLLRSANASVHAAGASILLCGLVIAVIGGLLPLMTDAVGSRIRASATARVAPVALALGAALALVTTHGVRSWVGDQYRACAHPVITDVTRRGTSHFAELGSNRCDFWRIEFHNWRTHPILGVGANNFQGTYVRQRQSPEEPRQAHSLPLQMLGELGAVGALLFALACFMVTRALVAFLRTGPARDPGVAGGAVAIAYWFAHASEDWLWNLPAVTLPVLVITGGLVACVSPVQRRLETRAAMPIALGIVVIAVASLAPQGLADRSYRASRDRRSMRRPADAIAHAHTAGRFDPTWAAPVIHEANLEHRRGNRRRAAMLAREAVRREPENWSIRIQAAHILRYFNRANSERELRAARRLNPQLEHGDE